MWLVQGKERRAPPIMHATHVQFGELCHTLELTRGEIHFYYGTLQSCPRLVAGCSTPLGLLMTTLWPGLISPWLALSLRASISTDNSWTYYNTMNLIVHVLKQISGRTPALLNKFLARILYCAPS